MIRFLAEIAFRSAVDLHPTPSPNHSRNKNIYYLDIALAPANSYWKEKFGGTFNEYTGTQIELYYSQFLRHVNTMDEVLTYEYTFWINPADYKVYFNIPKHPWLYPQYEVGGEQVLPFISSALKPDNPSHNVVRGVPAQTRLELPNFTVKLSDSISGVVLNQSFDLVLHNDDGYFDNDAEWNLFNTPVHLKKAVVENPSYSDFREIRSGLAASTSTKFDEFRISVEDKIRSLDDPVCNTIKQEDFPNYTLLESAIGKNIPVLYGRKRIKPEKIWEEKNAAGNVIKARYMLAEYIQSCEEAYDKDGNRITGNLTLENHQVLYNTKLDADGKLIEVSEVVIRSANFTNNAGVIKDILEKKSNIPFEETFWDISDYYKYYGSNAPFINIIFTSGDVKKAIADILKSDMAYFLQLSDGRFTVRRYGIIYGGHHIDSSMLTQKPEKNYDYAHNNYFSSCAIKYAYTGTNKETYKTFLYDENKAAAENKYRRKRFTEFETDIDISEGDNVRELAQLLGQRYSTMRQRIKAALAIDTTGMELLDIVTMDLTVNGRKFSNADKFIITEINHAQDILTLEEIDYG
ncbi:MAG: hypothetical protein LBG79_07775 [Spirochaetaceae bacterium]|jgi:hypothetical protein|nr:hypothetical protein [Spirochaetaceae bacterium]